MTKQLSIKDAVVHVPVRMSAELKNRIIRLADRRNVSINRQIVELLESCFEE